jgi:hypothetical protein
MYRFRLVLVLLVMTLPAIAQENAEMTAKDPNIPTARTANNRLAKATSPYLLQHAGNPVDWYEWGEEAFAKARAEDKPVFLSIGYAACHWCHVMEHESFEQGDVAGVLNEHFVSIKVDREERPDIDELYMAYTQAATGHGGWPMSVWLAPDGTPFHAGTYYPKEHFIGINTEIARMWVAQREEILKGANGAKKFFEQWAATKPASEGVIPIEAVDETAAVLARHFDKSLGGMSGGGTNKFPPSMAMDLMLRVHRRTRKAALAEAVDVTLDHMARGGIYDHLGGGICRYSTDPEWLVPHFEKMLYDQAMVSAIYLDGYQAFKKAEYAAVARDIFEYVLHDLRSPEGGFYSSRDADSEGLEGKFYLWTVEEVISVLGEQDGRLFCKYYDVTERGNWFERLGHAPPGPKNILRVTKSPEVFARTEKLDAEAFKEKLARWRATMREVRSRRVPPGLDDKILTDWNGLMIASLARGAAILDEPNYAQAAAQAAEFILAKMQKDGRLLRTYRKGEARLTATLSDYAFLVEGLLNLFEATFERRWLDEAERLTDVSVRYYFDEKDGAFFFTAGDGEKLLVRSKQPHDSAIPSGNSVHALNLQRLAILLGRKDYRAKAESIFRAFGGQAVESPGAFERLMCAADFYHDKVKEIAMVGVVPVPSRAATVKARTAATAIAVGAAEPPVNPATWSDNPDSSDPGAGTWGREGEAPAGAISQSAQTEEGQALLRAVWGIYLPNKVLAGAADKVSDSRVPLLTGKGPIGGKPTAYVCEEYRCQKPVQTAEELIRQLADISH